jgi:hypothetical protein
MTLGAGFHSQSSREAWQGIPTEDHKLIMGTGDSISNLTGTPSSSVSSNVNGRGHRTFGRTLDRRKVNFLNHSADDRMADTEPTDDTDDIDLIDDVLDQYNVNFATLCANVAVRKNSELIASGKHAHYQPSKRAPNLWVPNVPPGNVQQLLSDKVSSGGDISVNGVPYTVKKAGSSPAPTDINLEGVTYTVKMADLTTYRVSSIRHLDMTGTLVNQGANGGIAGSYCHVIEVNDQPQRFVNVEGIDGHVMTKRQLVTAGAVTETNRGPVILIMNQYAHSGKGHSIHSSPQLEWNQVDIDDKCRRIGGKQRLLSLDGFSIPMNIRRGLPYIDMQPFKDDEWEGPNSLPHVFLTQDADWDAKVLDLEQSENPEWYSNADDLPLLNPDFDIDGDYRHCIAYKVDHYDDSTTITDSNPNELVLIHDQDVYFD